ncbi:Dopey, N-terminal-domain-containing protein, partial [Dimargaris cristalligena]
LALLPGLEEENNEFFDQVLQLFDSICRNVEQTYFYQALFLCLITAPDLRGAALHYLARRLPKLTQLEDVSFVVGDDPSLMVHAFAATLRDQNPLVQRAILELLVNNFNLDSQLIDGKDITLLLSAAVEVILRRDMSLNRRLYAWFLGSSDSRRDKQEYFRKYVHHHLVLALKDMFRIRSTDLNLLQKPYRIMISLLDRSEIGIPLIQNLIRDILRCTYEFTRKNPVPQSDKVLQTARMFFEMTDPYLIWAKL